MTLTNTEIKEGFLSRPPTLDDASAVLAIMNACAVAVVGHSDDSLDDVLSTWGTPGLNLENDLRVISAPDGRLVAYAIVEDIFNPAAPEIDVYIHPYFWEDPTGSVDGSIMSWAQERSREAIAKAPADARVAMQAYTYSKDTYYKSILERAGMAIIRHAFRMKIDLDKAIPAPVWPEGITLRIYQSGEDKRPILEALRGSFQDHWGYVDSPFDEHYERWSHHWENDFDPSLWLLAMDGDQIAAICLCQSQHGDDETRGWVSTLGVTRAYRRQGLGLALLHHAFEEFRSRGKTSVGLGVDASSLTGATLLYEKSGMHVDERIDLYEKELRPGVVYGTQSVE